MPELPRRTVCVVNTAVIKNSRQMTSLLGRTVGVGRNGWGRVRTEFEIVRGEHRPSTISNSVWIRLVNLASLVTRQKNDIQRVVEVCEKIAGSRDPKKKIPSSFSRPCTAPIGPKLGESN